MIAELEARFAENVAVARDMLAVALADPWVTGSMGQKVAHPGFAVARRADEVALRLAAEIRMVQRDLPDQEPSECDLLDELVARRHSRTNGD